MVDLGLAAKVRPCLVLSVPLEESDRSLVTLVPHTTALRQSRFEVAVPVRFLRTGAFDAQGIVTVPTVRLMNRLGTLTNEQLRSVEKAVCEWLGIKAAP
jgi:mRNA interferase MazF